MEPSEVWKGKFGDEYHQRNWVDWQKRIPFWQHILQVTGARSVLEFGCGPGWNLSACRRAYPDVAVTGVEINDAARWQGEFTGLDLATALLECWEPELIFTAGCLIHIPPDDINSVMKELIEKSYRYVMAIEYEADEETEIEYRGQSGLLWKRPYGEMYKRMGLKMIETAKLQQDVGFDNCRYWLMEK